jgi:hypothetical protein
MAALILKAVIVLRIVSQARSRDNGERVTIVPRLGRGWRPAALGLGRVAAAAQPLQSMI